VAIGIIKKIITMGILARELPWAADILKIPVEIPRGKNQPAATAGTTRRNAF